MRNNYYDSFYMPESHYEVREKELLAGYCAPGFIQNHREIFFLAPTVPPVDHNPNYPDILEHPTEAFRYYKERGVNLLWADHKYMGSRGHLLVFKTLDQAYSFGFKRRVTVISRNGFQFFKETEPLEKIEEDLKDLPLDFYILDCEICPWSLKGKHLIKYSFQIPGECADLDRRVTDKHLGGEGDTDQETSAYMKSLANYTKETDLEIFVFDILACGNITPNGEVSDWKNGFYWDRQDKFIKICTLFEKTKVVKPVESYFVDLTSEFDMQDCIIRWERYCANGGEGFVFKPDRMSYTESGYPIQPMLKVRGKDYLRIIYGIDYLEPTYFDYVKRRSIKGKRLQAIQEHEISRMILKTFVEKKHDLRYKFLSAFFGVEDVNFRNVDKTL